MRRYVNPKLFFLFYIFSLHWLYSIYVKQFPLRETSTKALGRLLLYRAQVDPPDTLLYKDVLSLLVSSTHDESSEVRRRALSAIKAVAKVCAWSVFTLYLDTTCIIILPKFYVSRYWNIPGKSFSHHVTWHNCWSCNSRMFKRCKYSCKTCCRTMRCTCTPINKGYVHLHFVIISTVNIYIVDKQMKFRV